MLNHIKWPDHDTAPLFLVVLFLKKRHSIFLILFFLFYKKVRQVDFDFLQESRQIRNSDFNRYYVYLDNYISE